MERVRHRVTHSRVAVANGVRREVGPGLCDAKGDVDDCRQCFVGVPIEVHCRA